MAQRIRTEQLSVAFNGTPVIAGLDLEIAAGEFLVLLGPSGCGKSTLLNAIAGLVDIAGGRISIGERDVTWTEPKDRGIAMVFQSYALYPAMDVYGNLAFALRVAGLPKHEIETRVQRAAELLGLVPLLRRKPSALSGGQRQRVAIGRSLVRDVEVSLFDEPLSNLDAQMRAELRVEIKQLHQRLGNTTVYVTHDQVEALSLADRIAVMKGGVIQQLADPDTVYHRPANRFVASFLGSPPMNFIPGMLSRSGSVPGVHAGDVAMLLPRYAFAPEAPAAGQAIVGIRPEDILIDAEAARADVRWTGTVTLRESLGSETVLWSELAGARIAIRTHARVAVRRGDRIPMGFASERASLFDQSTEMRI
ncbi:MAG: ABC transporter ATP-binding protein [Proteobacteria bacterium]|nr:ABC transporter ATP-binding protein [Pseudomonadota bacterium]